MSAAVLAGAVLASGDDTQKAGPIGLLVVIVLCVVSYFLFRSMSRHLRKVRDGFPGGSSAGGPTPPSAPAALGAQPPVKAITAGSPVPTGSPAAPVQAADRLSPGGERPSNARRAAAALPPQPTHTWRHPGE